MKDSVKLNFELTPNDVSTIAATKARNQQVRISRSEKAGTDRQFRPWNCAFTDCRKPSE